MFLFVGKLEAIKQPLKLAQAFIDANSKGIPDAHLIYIGSGKVEHELRAMTKDTQNIHLVSFKNQSEMPIWYRVGNVLCLVSTTETWGLAVNEALACGCTVSTSGRRDRWDNLASLSLCSASGANGVGDTEGVE